MLSKTQIKKLGKSIRDCQNTSNEIPEELLISVQEHRTSFQKDIAEVFNILSEASKRVRKDRVVTFRIKRIESILSKIRRQPTMQLDTMGDIAGCRCIVQTDTQVLKIVELLERKFTIKGSNNYVLKPKKDGYNAYHLYVESPIDSSKKIEIQIRSQDCHNWSTLVEIIDVLFDRKIKEGEDETDLKEFLKLMSNKNALDISQKSRVIQIEESYNIYINLIALFSKNYLIIRNSWLKLEAKADHTYFVISVDKQKTPKISSYNNYVEAEAMYFQIFNENKESNVVLTHLDEVDFRKLCIAYSNYILIKHGFLKDWQEIIISQIEMEYKEKRRKNANLLVAKFRSTLEEEEALLRTEIGSIKEIMDNRNEEHYLSEDSKLDEWLQELEDRFNDGRQMRNQLDNLIEKNGRSAISQFLKS
ncbi:RelA/SpoT domain-containing protein [Pedobacter sp. R-06]|uniref:RelA/SpoT domain-containing protein n=1 Tax=Pedobacter sp. R-06 TaxID=3404051 RepID=UPI003CE9EAC0